MCLIQFADNFSIQMRIYIKIIKHRKIGGHINSMETFFFRPKQLIANVVGQALAIVSCAGDVIG